MEMMVTRFLNHSESTFKSKLLATFELFKNIEYSTADDFFPKIIDENDLYDQVGLLSSVVAQSIATTLVEMSQLSIPKDIYQQIVNGNHVLSVANTEATGGTNLRFIKSYKEDGKLYVAKKYSTNLGAADFVIVSYLDRDNDEQMKLALVNCRFGQQVCANDELGSFQDGMTGFFEANALKEGEFFELANSKFLLQLCFNLERFLLSILAYSIHQYFYELSMEAAMRVKFGEFRLIDQQYIQDKILTIKTNQLLVKGMLTNVTSLEGYENNAELSILKSLSIDKAIESVNATIECLGKKGLEVNTHLSKILGDLYCLKFLGGSKELHKIVAIDSAKRHFVLER